MQKWKLGRQMPKMLLFHLTFYESAGVSKELEQLGVPSIAHHQILADYGL